VTGLDLTAVRTLAERLGEREAANPEVYPADNIRDLFDAGIVQAAFPGSHGGSGWSLVDCCDAVEVIASHSASTALLLSMPLGLGGICGLGPGIAPSAHRDAWAEQTARIAADYAERKFYAACNSERGAGGNLDATKTIASRHPDGSFSLTGDKILASGGSHAHMFMSSAKVSQSDVPGAGVVEFFFVPTAAAGVEVKHDWDGFGMRSTESQSVRYEDAVAREMVGFPNFLELTIPTTYWYCIFAAVSLGCAVGILRILGSPAPSSPALRLRLAEAQMRVEAMRAYLHETARNWQPAAPAEFTARVLRVKSYISSESTRLAAELFALGGGRHYRRGDAAARLLSDSFAGTALRPPLGATLDVLADQFSL